MKIRSVKINKLWGKTDLLWNLDSRVNILTGINGAGKSTIMDLMAFVIKSGAFPKELVTKVSQVTIEMDNSDQLVCLSFNDNLLNLKKAAEKSPVYRELWEDVSRSVSVTASRNRRLNRMGITASVSYIARRRQLQPLNQGYLDSIKVDIVSTFDTALPSDIDHSRYHTLKEQGVRSGLDMELHDLQERYAFYLGGLATKMEQYVKDGNVVDKAYVEELYAQKNLFIEIVNEMFEESGKHINIDNSRLEFIIDEDDKHITMYELSSGEKQLLYILMTVLMEEKQEYVLFMDEPEISLHVDWQESLIEKILQLNPNCQLIIATHAPSVLLGGWQNHVRNIEDIKQ